MRKRLLNVKMALAAMIVGLGMSMTPAPAQAYYSCDNIGEYLACLYYIEGEWLILIGPRLDF